MTGVVVPKTFYSYLMSIFWFSKTKINIFFLDFFLGFYRFLCFRSYNVFDFGDCVCLCHLSFVSDRTSVYLYCGVWFFESIKSMIISYVIQIESFCNIRTIFHSFRVRFPVSFVVLIWVCTVYKTLIV